MVSKFPYPVLQENSSNSSYKPNLFFELDFESSRTTKEMFEFVFFIKINSQHLISLINKKVSSVVLKITSKLHTEYYEVSLNQDFSFTILIPQDKIATIDEIKFQAFISLNQSYDLKYFDELNEEYIDIEFILSKNDVLAISNIETVYIQQKSDPIFMVSLDKDPALKGYYFLFKENYIHIMMNANIYQDYFKTIKKSGSVQKRLIYSKLISEALFFVFLELKNEGYEKLSLKQSFKKVEIIFNSISDYGNFEDFYNENLNNESKFPFNELSKIIQKMSDYQFDKLILEMGKI
jgi:hypothetical protein